MREFPGSHRRGDPYRPGKAGKEKTGEFEVFSIQFSVTTALRLGN